MLKSQVVFWCLLAFVAVTSFYDAYAALETDRIVGPTVVRWAGPTIGSEVQTLEYGLYWYEKNPVGKWLLAHGGIAALIGAKTAGTLVVALVVIVLRRRRPAMAMASVCGIALCQCGVVLYLSFA